MRNCCCRRQKQIKKQRRTPLKKQKASISFSIFPPFYFIISSAEIKSNINIQDFYQSGAKPLRRGKSHKNPACRASAVVKYTPVRPFRAARRGKSTVPANRFAPVAGRLSVISCRGVPAVSVQLLPVVRRGKSARYRLPWHPCRFRTRTPQRPVANVRFRAARPNDPLPTVRFRPPCRREKSPRSPKNSFLKKFLLFRVKTLTFFLQ